MIRGEKVVLRALEADDLERLHRWMNDPEVIYWLGRRTPISLTEERRWLESERNPLKDLQLGIETLEGQFIGSCSLGRWIARTAALPSVSRSARKSVGTAAMAPAR